jgi:hypothetical protein
MNNSLAFIGRENEIKELRRLYMQRKHVLLVGVAGIGKTALLRQMRQHFPMLLCEETSSLGRICDGLERQLGWKHYKMNVIERKNRLIAYLGRRGEPVVFDNMALTPPRVARFVAHLIERIPIWVAGRSALASDIGAVWQHLYAFQRIELGPLLPGESAALIEASVAIGNVQSDARAHIRKLHQMAGGNPRILEELLIELAAREYKMDTSFGMHLLDLDRRIHEVATQTAATLQPVH